MKINIETCHPKDIKITVHFPIGDVREAALERQPDNSWIYSESNYKTPLSKTNWVEIISEALAVLLLRYGLGN
jgi:hypothetical protein